MPTINSVNVKITGDESGLKKATNEAQKDISKVGTSALSLGKIALGAGLGQMIGNAISGAIRTVTKEMDGAIERLDTINNYSKVMGNLGIGADDSAKSIDYLQEHLLGLPTSLQDAALAVQRFASVNKDIKASTVGFLALNNAILAGGASMQTQSTALEQIAQAYSKGKPDAMEWRAMLTAMPAQMNQIAQAAGYTSAVIGGDLYEAIQSGKFSMNDFMATVVRLNSEGVNGFANFEEQARNATGGVQTSIANLKNAVQRGIATVLDTIGQANIAGFINGIAAAIGTVANYIAAFVRLIKEAVAWLGVLFGFKIGGSGGKTADATKSTASNLAAADKSAGGVASGLNNAAGAAKKLNNQLASFDEMNVLRETSTGGSGGGGGGGGPVGAGSFAIPEIDWGLDTAKKNENQIEKILEKLKKAFNKFAKFLKPIAEVIADIWKSYLAPFFGWVGNEFLPAFFNAVGGALEFLGKVIKSIWTIALKPFVDGFLVPIAEFTGGIIVNVLNAVGDALSWMAQQQGAIEIIVQVGTAILAMVAAVELAKKAVTAWNAVIVFLNGTLTNFSQLNMPLLFRNTAEGLAGISKGTDAALAVTNKFKDGVGTLSGALQNSIVKIGLLSAALVAVKVVIEAVKTAIMAAEAAENQRITAVKKEAEAMRWNSEAVQRQIDLKNELKDLETELASGNLALMRAQEATAEAQKYAIEVAKSMGKSLAEARKEVETYNIKSNNLTADQRKLAQAIYELEEAEGRQDEAAKKVTATTEQQTLKTEQLTDAKWQEIMSEKQAEISAMIAQERYGDVKKALIELSKSTVEYTDVNGKMAKLTEEDMENMADFIGDQMAQINSDSGRAWKGVWDAADNTTKNLNKTSENFITKAKRIGEDYALGIKQGIINRSGDVLNMGGWLGSQLSASFKKVLGIHSPSKVMAEAGGFIVKGIEQGMEDQEGSLIRTTENLGKAITSAFDANVELPEMVGADAADKLDAVAGKAQANLTMNAENTAGAIESLANAIIAMQEDKQPIIVKVGEETLVDTMIEGINNASTMRNRGVINI